MSLKSWIRKSRWRYDSRDFTCRPKLGNRSEQFPDVFPAQGHEIFPRDDEREYCGNGRKYPAFVSWRKAVEKSYEYCSFARAEQGRLYRCVRFGRFEIGNEKRKAEDIYVIGGASVYEALLPYCEEVLVTKVDAEGGAETFFPNLDRKKQFVAVEESEPIEDNGYTIRFMKYRNTEVCEL